MTTEQKQEMTIEEKKKREERQHIDAIYWSGVLIWAGLIFGIEAADKLPEIGKATGWSWVFFGAGVYSVLMNLWRSSSPDYTDPTTGDCSNKNAVAAGNGYWPRSVTPSVEYAPF